MWNLSFRLNALALRIVCENHKYATPCNEMPTVWADAQSQLLLIISLNRWEVFQRFIAYSNEFHSSMPLFLQPNISSYLLISIQTLNTAPVLPAHVTVCSCEPFGFRAWCYNIHILICSIRICVHWPSWISLMSLKQVNKEWTAIHSS